MVNEYIRVKITTHLGVHNISYREEQIHEMVESVLSGTGALQIIYEDVFDPYGEDGDEAYTLERWKPLDRNLIRETTTAFGTMYSYDGGKRYQWSEMETILIDLEALREIKLKNLGI